MDGEFSDDPALAEALRAEGASVDIVPWSDAAYPWDDADLVLIRTTWDYTLHHAAFVAWVQGLRVPVLNAPDVVVWNSDKRYLADLAAAGLPVVPTHFVAPGDALPPDLLPGLVAEGGQVVVKPSVSAGGRDTGRFGAATLPMAQALVETITAGGRTAMVQPFLPGVDEEGETAVVVVDGTVSHVLRKGSVLRPDEVAPVRGDALGAAEAMYDPGLVRAATATSAELALAAAVVGAVRERFGTTPLVCRVDLLPGAEGPVLLELEAVEPHLYLDEAPGALGRLAAAILRRARA
jgi:glutathione synthase/RimK-type ligase-like ATP-grasp enzyme